MSSEVFKTDEVKGMPVDNTLWQDKCYLERLSENNRILKDPETYLKSED